MPTKKLIQPTEKLRELEFGFKLAGGIDLNYWQMLAENDEPFRLATLGVVRLLQVLPHLDFGKERPDPEYVKQYIEDVIKKLAITCYSQGFLGTLDNQPIPKDLLEEAVGLGGDNAVGEA